MTSVSPPSPPTFLDRREEDVALKANYRGRIACRTLTIPKGVRLTGEVIADKTFLRGSMEGSITGSRGVKSQVTIDVGAEMSGEIHATEIVVAGNSDAILHGITVVTKSTARIAGYVLCDVLRHDEGASFDAGMFVGPGKWKSSDLLATVRRLKGINTSIRSKDLGVGDVTVVSASNDEERHLEARISNDLEDFFGQEEIVAASPMAAIASASAPVQVVMQSTPVVEATPVIIAPVAAAAPDTARTMSTVASAVELETPMPAVLPVPEVVVVEATTPRIDMAAPAVVIETPMAPPARPAADTTREVRIVPSLIRRRPAHE